MRRMTAVKKLKKEVDRAGSLEAVAVALGTSRQVVHYLVQGVRPPSLEMALKMEAIYGISPGEWVGPLEVETVKRVVSAGK